MSLLQKQILIFNLQFDLNIAFRMMPTPTVQKGVQRDVQAAHTRGPSVVWRLQGSQYCFVKHILWALLCECRTCHILGSLQVTGQLFSNLWSDRFLFFLGKFLRSSQVSSEVNLGPNRQERSLWTVRVISGTDSSFTFSDEDGETTGKQTRDTSVCG